MKMMLGKIVLIFGTFKMFAFFLPTSLFLMDRSSMTWSWTFSFNLWKTELKNCKLRQTISSDDKIKNPHVEKDELFNNNPCKCLWLLVAMRCRDKRSNTENIVILIKVLNWVKTLVYSQKLLLCDCPNIQKHGVTKGPTKCFLSLYMILRNRCSSQQTDLSEQLMKKTVPTTKLHLQDKESVITCLSTMYIAHNSSFPAAMSPVPPPGSIILIFSLREKFLI